MDIIVTRPLRVGIAGTGRWATHSHIPGFRSCDNVEIVAISSRDRARAEETARELGIPHAYASAAEMMANSTIDLVSVVSADDCHIWKMPVPPSPPALTSSARNRSESPSKKPRP